MLQSQAQQTVEVSVGRVCTIAEYLLERLVQLNVTSIFGVPGDFNLAFLDYIESHSKLGWVGNCNELNAAYAADGYARVKEGSIGVVVTTFGQKNKLVLHHTFGDGRYDMYFKAAQQVVISHASLQDKATAAAEIDRVITDCVLMARPVYLVLPTDLVSAQIPAERLQTPLNTEPPQNDPETESVVLDEIVKLIEEAERGVIILVDACSIRRNVKDEVFEFAKKTRFPVYSTPMGKTAIPEDYELHGGIYAGVTSRPEVKAKVESAKLIISVGGLKTNFNTGNFTNKISPAQTVELHSDHTRIRLATYHGIGMKHLLPKLTERMQPFKEDVKAIDVPEFTLPVSQEDNDKISHLWLWPRLGQFFKKGDIIVAEAGTAYFGALEIPMPGGSVFMSQFLWCSIGWTVGSTLGAAIAARDMGLPRVILFVGDGSIQMTAQELSTMIRYGVKPIIFVLKNNGYTAERYLHDENAQYNDIATWQGFFLPPMGGTEGETCQSYTVRTKNELSQLLDNVEFAKAEKIQLVEPLMDTHDAPRVLKVLAALLKKAKLEE
ncbi:uncharacterized protein PHACADRAFT_167159 [Phanerochaete carnosa HHB-10118-sp]|uniref:Pyruvate decarboxylase n=1 Tax=Phanerochaete carnosa (strain HHB-10118-sp) TaxID=650164 RepID=K5UJU8_PHACS|nr:uncharacterized protein PHACADRAFT_167159 [Phanerochaete carnosa HHB-10118-sp]EKM49816.1 hypothetical protein PHACADRAFT_167159 [Phanerochaete carnosa HHB-10118-sp]